MKIKDLLKDAYREGMTLEEIETALAEIELPGDNAAEIKRLKDAVSKANSEAADYKKQLRAKQTDDEAAEAKRKEEFEKLQSDHNELLHKMAVSENKAKLLALGYDEALAGETAEAMAKGETDKVFAAQQKHQEAIEKKIRADILKDTPKPTGGSAPGGVDYQKMIDEAQQRGDLVAAAYYTRVAAEQAAGTKP